MNKKTLLCLSAFLSFSFSTLYAAPLHTITVDGDLSDWTSDENLPAQGNVLYNPSETSDSVWDPGTGKNEIKSLYVTWDKQNLYLGISAQTNNAGLLVYIDVDSGTLPGIDSGPDNLYYIATWNRKVKFPVFKPDFFYGAWSGSNGNLYKITSSTSVSDISSYASLSTAKTSSVPGSEMKIPWNVLYGAGSENVPAGARVAVFASLCTGDTGSELYGGATIQYGFLGGDCVPDSPGNNIFTFSASTVTDFAVANLDSDLNGSPDDKIGVFSFSILADNLSNKVFSPYGVNNNTNLTVNLSRQSVVTIKIFDINGNLILEPVTNASSAGVSYLWNGKDASGAFVKAGVYIIAFRADSGTGEVIRKNYSVAVIK